MLKILLESLLLECAELGLDADNVINNLYATLNSSHTTDLQKEIKAANINIQGLKLMCYEIVTSEEFKEELSDLNITFTVNQDPADKEVIAVLTTLDNALKADYVDYYNELRTDSSIKNSIEQIGDSIREAHLQTETVRDNKQIYLNTFIDLCNVYNKLI